MEMCCGCGEEGVSERERKMEAMNNGLATISSVLE